MTLRRTLLYSLSIMTLAGAMIIAFCPRPELYGDVEFSAAAEDRHGRLLRLAT